MVFADPKTSLLDKANCKSLFRSMGQAPLEADLRKWVDGKLIECVIIRTAVEYYQTVEGKVTEGIDFDQFLSFFCRFQQGLPMVQTVINIFHSFDPDRDGFLHRDALRKILTVGDTALSEEEVNQFLRVCDSVIPENPSWKGHIDYVKLANA